ncbi:MAG: hypothetical protein HY709_12165 [Candidatus Latescibacteria bacterium]|nr:hypothetical protein [Candidatus Latescibacterota bacterium]
MKIDASFPHFTPFSSDLSKEMFLNALKEGDLLQGRVIKQLNDETWLIRTAGHDLVARSSSTLVEGQMITARVDALGPPVFLTLLESGIVNNPEEAISRMLSQGGIRDDPLNRAVLLRMIASGLQITGAEVEAVRQALIRLKVSGPNMRDVIDQILRLRARSVPVNEETLSMSLPRDAGLLFGKTLDQLLRDLLATASDDSEVTDLLNRLVGLFITADEIDEESLRRGIRDGGLGLEAKLAALLDAADDQIRSPLKDDLKGLLLALRAVLDARLAGAISEDERHRLTSFMNRLSDTLRLITAFQLTNLPQKTPDQESYLYLYLPVWDGDHWETVGIRVGCREEEGRRVIDPEQTVIGVELDMAALGRVDVSCSINGHTIDGRIQVEDAVKRVFLEEGSDELRQGLERIGYRLRHLTVGLMPEEEAEESFPSKMVGLDVRI